DRQVPYFTDYVKRYSDLPFLVRVEERDGAYVPGKFLTAADLPGAEAESEHAAFKTVILDAATGRPLVPNGSLGFRFGESGEGRWNLDLGDADPLLSVAGGEGGEAVEIELARFDGIDGAPGTLRRGVPVRTVGGHLVTTVFD
ncbi:nitrate reductase subunit alpha, partial [Micromonospora aurantiaca]|nr:nitrate reductase subunit alpha [Micromonospora aurantiaca]